MPLLPRRRRVLAVKKRAEAVQRLLAGICAVREREETRIQEQARTACRKIDEDFERAEQVPSEEAREKLEQIKAAYGQRLATIQKTYDEQIELLEREMADAAREARAARSRRDEQFEQRVHDLEAQFGWSERGWDDPSWQDFVPVDGLCLPHTVRAGRLTVPGRGIAGNIPALLPIIGSRNVVIRAAGSAKDQALWGMQSIMLRLLAGLPPGKLRFVLVDPVGLGTNVAGFLHLPEELYTGKVWTEPSHIEQRLADLSSHMETVIQTYLLNRYPTMEDYNEKAGEVAEAYRLLVIANFPANFTEAAAQRLLSIASNGLRTGVYVLILVDTARELPREFQLAELERTAAVIEQQDDHFIWRDPDLKTCPLRFDEPPAVDLFNGIVSKVADYAERAKTVQVPFDKITIPPETWWSGTTVDGIAVPIGMEGATDYRLFKLDSDTVHALLVGRTGSGKSTLLHVLILRLALTYSPDQLELYLIDFKKGVEFKDYAVHQLPHARVVAIQSEREFGLSVLQKLGQELQDRGDAFRAAGVNSLESYRERGPTARIPRILLVVDEFHEFFSDDDALARDAARLLDRLVRQGRGFGIHVLLASQNLSTHGLHGLPQTTIDQMAVRIALRCTEADSRKILGDDNPAARMLSRPGEAIYNDANGLIEGNSKFQVIWLPDKQRVDYLEQIHRYAQQRGWKADTRQIVFEGEAPADIEANVLLAKLLERGSAGVGPSGRKDELTAWLGEPIAIEPPTSAVFRRTGGRNLLVIGRDETAAAGLCIATLVSIAAQRPPNQNVFAVADLSDPDGAVHQTFKSCVDILPHKIELLSRQQLVRRIQELSQLIEECHQGDDSETPKLMGQHLIIFGLQRIRELRGEDAYTPSELGQQFTSILRAGNEVGVHMVVWGDSYASIERLLPRGAVEEFGLRVGLQMGAGDSTGFLNSDDASELGPYRALFADDDRPGAPKKFRPYGLPAADWLRRVGESMRQVYGAA
jgi:S-DNA-T family DNA segregation ATPase FtsK/SpoIIIE